MRTFVQLGLAVAACLLAGCNAIGPKTVRGARLNYNEAIAQSWNQQLLLNLVRLKYRDTPFFLEINSVSTQYSMSYNSKTTFGFLSYLFYLQTGEIQNLGPMLTLPIGG